MEKDAKKV